MSATQHEQASDAHLLALVAAGDRQAFALVYQRYERRCLGYARQLLRDTAAAEDVVIEALTAVWNNAASFTGGSMASTWILGIVRHKALDRIRSNARHAASVPVDAAEAVPDPGPGPEDQLGADDSGRKLRQVLQLLSPEHREALRLAFFEELPYEEISLLLGIPANTVKTRVYHAKLQLRRHLDAAASKVRHD